MPLVVAPTKVWVLVLVEGMTLKTSILKVLEVLLEISDVQPGQNGKGAISDLQPGTYAFICNIPGHYSSGTVGKFIVR